MAENKNPIPFGKAMRIGNYKIWRSKSSISYTPSDEERAKMREESNGKRKTITAKYDIDVINVSNLDGSWSTKIPSTQGMYSTIMLAFEQKEKDRDTFLTMLFGNFYMCCTVNNVFIHDAFSCLMNIMQFPYVLLPEKEMVKRMKEGYKKTGGTDKDAMNNHIAKMCDYRTQLFAMIEKKKSEFIEAYEAELEMSRRREESAQEDLKHEELAEQAADIVENKKE